MRAFVGVLLAAVALGGSLALHNYAKDTFCPPVDYTNPAAARPCVVSRSAWVDPLALALAIAGVGCGVVLVAQARRLL
jgi:hypothetical protein